MHLPLSLDSRREHVHPFIFVWPQPKIHVSLKVFPVTVIIKFSERHSNFFNAIFSLLLYDCWWIPYWSFMHGINSRTHCQVHSPIEIGSSASQGRKKRSLLYISRCRTISILQQIWFTLLFEKYTSRPIAKAGRSDIWFYNIALLSYCGLKRLIEWSRVTKRILQRFINKVVFVVLIIYIKDKSEAINANAALGSDYSLYHIDD